MITLIKQFKEECDRSQLFCCFSVALSRLQYFIYTFGITIWFQSPILYCRNSPEAEYAQCKEIYICKNKISDFYIDYENSYSNLSTEFGILCEEKHQIISFLLLGVFFGSLVNLLISFTVSKRMHSLIANYVLSIVCLVICLFNS